MMAKDITDMQENELSSSGMHVPAVGVDGILPIPEYCISNMFKAEIRCSIRVGIKGVSVIARNGVETLNTRRDRRLLVKRLEPPNNISLFKSVTYSFAMALVPGTLREATRWISLNSSEGGLIISTQKHLNDDPMGEGELI